MKTIEHQNDCILCGDDADNPWTVFETVAKADGTTEVVGQAAFRTPYVQIGALIGALCDDCKTALKALANPTNATERTAWRDSFKVNGANRIAAMKAEITRQEEAARIESARVQAENLAKQQAAEQTMAAAQVERAANFAKLAPDEQLKAALAAVLDGSATDEERETFKTLAVAST